MKRIITHNIIYYRSPVCNQTVLITGKGRVIFGNNCEFGYKLGGFHKYGYIEIQPRGMEAIIKIGDDVVTNNNIFICARKYIEIGSSTLIGQGVIMMDHESHGSEPDKRRQIGKVGEIFIGKNVWIGNNVTILKGTTVGDNSIIAAGAVVSGIFPENVIIGGIPAKTIKKL